MKFCSKCGTQINDNSKFCGTCGAKQEVSQPLVQQPSNMQGQTDCLCDGKSIASMICGLFSIVLGFVMFISLIIFKKTGSESETFSIISAVSGLIAFTLSIATAYLSSSFKKKNGAHNVMSKVGIITGSIGIVFVLIGIVFIGVICAQREA